MRLTVVTINYNNAVGLEKTMKSVVSQSRTDFEYVVVDGASTDGSVEVIRRYASAFSSPIKWLSEPDNGIYNAMNKGIRMASGEYLEFLNSGDCFVSENVIGEIYDAMEKLGRPSILYGNMLKSMMDGKVIRDKGFAGQEITFLGFYIGTLNHSSAIIRKDLFDKYGSYDESLRIVSDWKWFLLAIVFGGEKPIYSDFDISLFDMGGISETNVKLTRAERRKVLEDCVPSAFLADYKQWSSAIQRMKRIQRHPWAAKIVRLIERYLFKLEKY